MARCAFPISCFLLLLALLGGDAHGQIVLPSEGYINTIAGNGIPGYSGDGGLAIDAKLNRPSQVAVDGSGNVYIADQGNNVIRKVTASSGVITTVAGNGVYGYSGDGGPATSAELCSPTGIAVDSTGNIFIGEGCATGFGGTIREVKVSTGIITTIAGGGTLQETVGSPCVGIYAGSLDLDPTLVEVDVSDNLYFLNVGEFCAGMIKMPVSTGIISSVEFSGAVIPSFVLDAADDIYWGRLGGSYVPNYSVEETTATSSRLIAGDGIQGYTGDGGTATSAEINPGNGIALDTSGSVYFSTVGAIRLVNVLGRISTVAGGTMNGYSGDGGLAVNALLNDPGGVAAVRGVSALFVSDSGNSRIRAIGINNRPICLSRGCF